MISKKKYCGWLSIAPSRLSDWYQREGSANCHNSALARSSWLLPAERTAIIDYYLDHVEQGYRRLSYMMLDEGVVAVSPSSVYRVLSSAGLLRRWSNSSTKKGRGFEHPQGPHEHWHVDFSYLNIGGTFYYLCALLDGYSRFVVHWEIRKSMSSADVQIVIERARERYPEARPRIISDNGKQFTARELKEYLRLCGMSHVRTSPYYPQSNGKLERFHGTYKQECIRPQVPGSEEDGVRITGSYIEHYNNVRLHSAIGYITPRDKLIGNAESIFEARKTKLKEAKRRREEMHANQTQVEQEESSLTQQPENSVSV